MRTDTRQHIIHHASQLFYNKGYNSTGINEIIEVSGIAKATLYSHFKSKEDLLLAYIDAKDEALLENLSTFCNKKAQGKDRLMAVLEYVEMFFQDDAFNGCWCIRTAAEVPKENKRVRSKLSANKKIFKKFIEDLVKENKPNLDSDIQDVISDQLYLLYEGAITGSHLHNAAWPIETALALFKSILKES